MSDISSAPPIRNDQKRGQFSGRCTTESRFRSRMGRAESENYPTGSSSCLQQIVADAPFIARGMAEQACGGEEEPAPAPHPERGICAVDRTQHVRDLVAMGIEIAEPVVRGALVVSPAPAPFALDGEQVAVLPDQLVRRH